MPKEKRENYEYSEKQKALKIAFAKRLKELREEIGLSHEKLAQELKKKQNIEIGSKTLMLYEIDEIHHSRFKAGFGINMLYLTSLANYFDVSVDYMLGGTTYKSPNNEKIGKITGLSDEAIEVLKTMIKEYKYEKKRFIQEWEQRPEWTSLEQSSEYKKLLREKIIAESKEIKDILKIFNDLLTFNNIEYLIGLLEHIWLYLLHGKEHDSFLKAREDKMHIYAQEISTEFIEVYSKIHSLDNLKDLEELRAIKTLQKLMKNMLEKEVQNG